MATAACWPATELHLALALRDRHVRVVESLLFMGRVYEHGAWACVIYPEAKAEGFRRPWPMATAVPAPADREARLASRSCRPHGKARHCRTRVRAWPWFWVPLARQGGGVGLGLGPLGLLAAAAECKQGPAGLNYQHMSMCAICMTLHCGFFFITYTLACICIRDHM